MATNNTQPPQYANYDMYKRVDISEEVPETNNRASESRIETTYASPRRAGFTIFKRWWLEVLSILVSIGVLIAIHTLLKQYDGKQTSDWTMIINLTTLVAILSTLGRMSLVTIVSQIIAQAKWSKFWHRERLEGGKDLQSQPLNDMAVYDSASRGEIWSSVQLFSKGARSPSVVFSVLVMLLSVAMASFAQQAVRTVNCEFADEVVNASIPSIQAFGNFGFRVWDEKERRQLSYATKASLISSIANPSGVESEIRATCSSGNCTFPRLLDDTGRLFTHRAMGFCSKCVDTSSLATYSKFQGQKDGHENNDAVLSTSVSAWSLPTGQNVSYRSAMTHGAAGTGETQGFVTEDDTAFLNVMSDGMNLDWIARNSSNDVADLIKLALHGYANISFLSLQDTTSDRSYTGVDKQLTRQALGSACTIYPCVKSYLASMVNSKYSETLVSSETLPLFGDLMMIVENDRIRADFRKVVWPTDAIAVASPCLVDGQVYTKSNMSSAPGAIPLTRLKYDDTRTAFDQTVLVALDKTTSDYPGAINITAPPQCIFGVEHWDWYKSMRDFLAGTFHGTCGDWGTAKSWYMLPSCVSDYDARDRYQSGYTNPWWLEELTKTSNRTTSEITKWLDGVTESMTRRFRLSSESYGKQPWSQDVRSTNGTVMHTTTCFSIEWQWLIFPLTLTLIGTVVLLWTLVKEHFGLDVTHGREMVWKSSILPFIYHQERFVPIDYFDRADEFCAGREQGWTALMDLDSMEKDAKEYKVVFSG